MTLQQVANMQVSKISGSMAVWQYGSMAVCAHHSWDLEEINKINATLKFPIRFVNLVVT